MAFDDTDWQIVDALHLNPSRTARQVASIVGISETCVRNRLLGLEKSGAVSISSVIDLRPLGFHEYSLWFNSSNSTPSKERGEALEALTKCSRVIAINDFGATFEIILCAKGPDDLRSSIDELYARYDQLPNEKLLSIWTRWTFLPRCRAAVRTLLKPTLTSRTSAGSRILDELDHQILVLLSKLDTRRSAGPIARELKRPERTVQYRLDRLQENGVLVGRVLNPAQGTGSSLLHRLAVSLDNSLPGSRERVRCILEREGRVQSIVDCLGHWDFEALIEGLQPDHSNSFLERLRKKCGGALRAGKLFPLVSRPKFSPYPFSCLKDIA